MKLKKLIGICCILFCVAVCFSVRTEKNITIKDYEWEENMEIVKEYRTMKKGELETFYNGTEDTIKVNSIDL